MRQHFRSPQKNTPLSISQQAGTPNSTSKTSPLPKQVQLHSQNPLTPLPTHLLIQPTRHIPRVLPSRHALTHLTQPSLQISPITHLPTNLSLGPRDFAAQDRVSGPVGEFLAFVGGVLGWLVYDCGIGERRALTVDVVV